VGLLLILRGRSGGKTVVQVLRTAVARTRVRGSGVPPVVRLHGRTRSNQVAVQLRGLVGVADKITMAAATIPVHRAAAFLRGSRIAVAAAVVVVAAPVDLRRGNTIRRQDTVVRQATVDLLDTVLHINLHGLCKDLRHLRQLMIYRLHPHRLTFRRRHLPRFRCAMLMRTSAVK